MALFLVGLLVGAMGGILAVGIKIMREDTPSSGGPSSFSRSWHSLRYTGGYTPCNYQRPKPPHQVKFNGDWWRLEGFDNKIATISFANEVKIIPKKFVEQVRVI